MTVKKRTKVLGKLIVLLGCILYFNAVIPAHAAEKTGACGEDLTWSLAGDMLTITGSGDMIDYSDGALSPWYGMASQIRIIVLPEGMTSIGDYAFFGCENLVNILIPSTVTEVGAYAFGQCRSLIRVEWQEGIEIVGEGAFEECEALPKICFPSTLSEIGEKAFYRCYSFSDITVPSTVKMMGPSAFAYCTKMVRATINAPLEELPGWTFYGCSNLVDVSLASSIVSTGEYAFLFCENLEGIYTQDGQMTTVHQLEETVYEGDGAPEKGSVKAYAMPESSIVTTDDGKMYIQITAVQKGETVICEKKQTDYSTGENITTLWVQACVSNEEDWNAVIEETLTLLETEDELVLEIQLFGDTAVDGKNLSALAGKPLDLHVTLDSGSVAQIDMGAKRKADFSETYDFQNAVVNQTEATEETQETEPVIEDMSSGPVFEEYDAENMNGNLAEDGSNLMDANGTEYQVVRRYSKWGITGKQFAVYASIVIGAVVMVVTIIMFTLNYMKRSKEMYQDLANKKKESPK